MTTVEDAAKALTKAPSVSGFYGQFFERIFTMTVDEMANREARRVEILRIIKHQSNIFKALDEICVIQRDLKSFVNKGQDSYAYLYAFLLGKICGIREERARRAKKKNT